MTSANIGPYMDVMTVRPSQAAYRDTSGLSSKSISSTSSSSSASSSSSTQTSHHSLFMGPVVMPDMRDSYASLAPPMNSKESCLFYATGDKSLNLKKTLENTIRRANGYEEDQSLPPPKPIKHPKKPEPELCPKPRPVLFYTKKKGNNETKKIINKSRDNEVFKNPVATL